MLKLLGHQGRSPGRADSKQHKTEPSDLQRRHLGTTISEHEFNSWQFMVGPQRAQMFGRADSKSAHPPTARTQLSAVGNAKTSGSTTETEVSDLKITMIIDSKFACMNCAHGSALRNFPGTSASCVLTNLDYRTASNRSRQQWGNSKRPASALRPQYVTQSS